MPLNFARRLIGHHRHRDNNVSIGIVLCMVAGATNAGGFLAVRQYTSHMTGIVSSIADNAVLHDWVLVGGGLMALAAFIAGSMCTTLIVNFSRRRHLRSTYAIPLMLEALLLLVFGLLGARLSHIRWLFEPTTVMLLCFIMGLQNALITKLSDAEIRTTHLTGIITDIGIELGKMSYWNRTGADVIAPVQVNRAKLWTLTRLAGSFFFGALLGAWGFKTLGYISTIPLAVLLCMLAAVPAIDDLNAWIDTRPPGRT